MKIQTLILAILCIAVAAIAHLPGPYWKITPAAILISFLSCIVLGWVSLIRNQGWRKALTPNPFTHYKAISNSTLNQSEKRILIWFISISASGLISLLVMPVIDKIFSF